MVYVINHMSCVRLQSIQQLNYALSTWKCLYESHVWIIVYIFNYNLVVCYYKCFFQKVLNENCQDYNRVSKLVETPLVLLFC